MNPQVPEKEQLKLKHFFQTGIGLGLFVAIVGLIFWLKTNPSKTSSVKETDEVAERMEGVEGEGRPEDTLAENTEPTPLPEKSGTEKVDLAKASEFFGQNMKPLASCLTLDSSPSTDPLEPTFDNLLAAVSTDFGNPILRSDDWVSWNLRVGSEERRIRIETDYSDSDETTRHLMYFKLDPQGQPTMIPLPEDQTKNPSEAFIASLQKDGEVYEEEKGRRAYFDNGQELVLTEKNSHIDSFELSNGSKTFRCAGILSSAPRCKCY